MLASPPPIVITARAVARRIHPDMYFDDNALEALMAHDWPGNARELRNVLTRAFVLSGPHVQLDSLMFNPLDTPAPRARMLLGERPLPALEQAERSVLEEALNRTGQNRSAAAKELGIPRSSLIYKLKRFGLS